MPFTLISRMQEEGGLYLTVILLLVAIWKTKKCHAEFAKLEIFTAYINYLSKMLATASTVAR